LRETAFQRRHQIDHRPRRDDFSRPDRHTLQFGFDQSSQCVLITIAERARLEVAAALSDDRLGNRAHFGIGIAFGAAELRQPDLVSSPPGNLRSSQSLPWPAS
jgi:hypothetical protein